MSHKEMAASTITLILGLMFGLPEQFAIGRILLKTLPQTELLVEMNQTLGWIGILFLIVGIFTMALQIRKWLRKRRHNIEHY